MMKETNYFAGRPRLYWAIIVAVLVATAYLILVPRQFRVQDWEEPTVAALIGASMAFFIVRSWVRRKLSFWVALAGSTATQILLCHWLIQCYPQHSRGEGKLIWLASVGTGYLLGAALFLLLQRLTPKVTLRARFTGELGNYERNWQAGRSRRLFIVTSICYLFVSGYWVSIGGGAKGTLLLRILWLLIIQLPFWCAIVVAFPRRRFFEAKVFAISSVFSLILVGVCIGWWILLPSSLSAVFLLPIEILAVILIVLIKSILGILHPFREAARERLVQTGLVAGSAYAAFAAWAVLFGNLYPSINREPVRITASEYLTKIAGCSWEYREVHREFPRDLDVLGTSGTNCLPPDMMARTSGNGRFSLTGTRDHFTAQVVYSSIWRGNTGWYQMDENGVAVSKGLGLVFPFTQSSIVRVTNCLALYRDKNSHGTFPEDLQQALVIGGSACLAGRELFLSESEFVLDGYSLRYTPKRGRNGAVVGFVLTDQPTKYNSPYIRSYYADETGIVRATAENRPATASDSEIPREELPRYNPPRNREQVPRRHAGRD